MSALTSTMDKCTSCGLCVEECVFLKAVSKTPRAIAEGLVRGDEEVRGLQFLCFLCGLCKAVCPNQVDVAEMMLRSRRDSADLNVQQNPCYRVNFPDEPAFLIGALKERMDIDFSEHSPSKFKHAFFPGCSMACFSPKAVVKVYEVLAEELGEVGVLDLCCGKPLHDSGLESRARAWLEGRVVAELKRRGCEALVTACPNCFYYLKPRLWGRFKVSTPYGLLRRTVGGFGCGGDPILTIHDSCPDRFEGIFGEQVRKVLSGCRILEMRHSKTKTLCCGAGGLVSCSNAVLPLTMASARFSEFAETGASLMVVYCYTCANMFWSAKPNVEVKHALNLVLNVGDNSELVKRGEVGRLIMDLMTNQG
ncbi:MAG: (Fe-S)-binding protein [Candidatus Nezhaarchaeota archaeon]|nr:(Fe-S)-binding protein [Candidatus Nezhaarchaeota archaeon]